MRVRAEILTGDTALDPQGPAGDVVGPWRELAVAAGNAFLTPEWFAAWRRHYDPADGSRVVVVRDHDPDDVDSTAPPAPAASTAPAAPTDPAAPPAAGAIVGVLPVEIAGRTIRFAGANLGERYFPAAPPELRGPVAAAAATALGDAFPGAHLVLHHVPRPAEGSDGVDAWTDDLRAAWPRRLTRIPLRSDVLPSVPLPGTWHEFLAARSRNFRNQVGRKERNLVKAHGARFRTVGGAASGSDGGASVAAPVATEMKQFFALHTAQWEDRESGTTLSSPDAQAFHLDFAAAAHEQGWLRLLFCEADGRDVAALYGFTLGGRACYFNAGWDPSWSSTSVGLVVLAQAVRTAVEEGATVYDFLLGAEDYKYRFATEEETVETFALAPLLSPAQPALRLEGGLRRLAAAVPEERKAQVRGVVRPIMSRLPGGRRR